MGLRELPENWRELAGLFRSHADESVALAYERCAEELVEALEDEAERILTLREASEVSGYSIDHLGREVREGRIPNAGRPGAPRIRAGDLPRKTGVLIGWPSPEYDGDAKGQIVRSIVAKGGGRR